MLTRPEREAIAHSLEQFFDDHIHGATDAALKAWREGVEHRFDLRLKLDGSHAHVTTQRTDQLLDAASSLCSFVKYLVQPEPSQLMPVLKSLRIASMLSDDQKQRLLSMELAGSNVNFEPPGLDPASDITESYLKDLATCCTATVEPAEELEQLVLEACSYFRRTPAEGRQWLNDAWKQRVRAHCPDQEVFDTVTGSAARGFFQHREADDRIVLCYGGLSLARGNHLEELSDCWLIGLEDATGRKKLVLTGPGSESLKWSASVPVNLQRIKGLFVDDARIQPAASSVSRDALQISGSLRGGRFKTYFEPLLKWSHSAPDGTSV